VLPLFLMQTLMNTFCHFYESLNEEVDKKTAFLLLSADFGYSRRAVMKNASELLRLQDEVRHLKA